MTTSVRPQPSPPRPWSFPAIADSRLSNGVRVLSCHLPGRPVIHVSVLLETGAASEPISLAGAGSLVSAAFGEGTAQRDAEQLTEATELLGAGLGCGCGWDDLVVSATVPTPRLRPALELLIEAYSSPAFPEPDIERLLKQRLEAFRNARFQPPATSGRVFRSSIYAEGTRLSVEQNGFETSIGALTRDHVVSFYSSAVEQAARTAIIAGDLEGADAHAILDDTLGRLSVPPGGGESYPGRSPSDAGPPGPRIVVVNHPGAVQTNIAAGHIGPGSDIPDRAALDVGAAVVGGGYNARLNRRLREELGYTYGANGGFTRGRFGGYFRAGCAVQSDATADSVRELLAVLRRAVSDGLTDTEVASFREGLYLRGPVELESTGAVVGRLTSIIVNRRPLDDPDTHRAAILAATTEEASAALSRYLRPDEMVVVASGDAGKIAGPLREISYGEVTVVEP